MIHFCTADLKRGYSLLQRGHRLEKRLITNLGGISFLDCVEECLRRTRCLSVNYFQPAHFCEVNYKKKESLPDLYFAKGWYYSERDDWDKAIVGPCSNPNCQENEMCVPKALGAYTCEISDCGIPMNEGISFGNIHDSDAIGIQRKMHITCLDGYEKEGSEVFICQTNGVWKSDLKCIKKYELQGCFEDDHNRVLESGPHSLQINGQRKCASHCATLGYYNYFGLQAGSQCFCGNNIRNNPRQLPITECHGLCNKNYYEECGRMWKMLIFAS
uniref:Uncharacterized protein LOC111116841 n=1 Tax=Crassostrea virginica TaxID=6565 RepID=A0A8B8C763_CRAVI|nr:uncharacterized protein LOC111116841 [Crassostrea virginica]